MSCSMPDRLSLVVPLVILLQGLYQGTNGTEYSHIVINMTYFDDGPFYRLISLLEKEVCVEQNPCPYPSCDPLQCKAFHECCIDYNIQMDTGITLQKYINDWNRKRADETCEPIDDTKSYIDRVWMVTSCLSQEPDTASSSCPTNDRYPVYSNGEVFINKPCALCNNVSEGEIQTINKSRGCDLVSGQCFIEVSDDKIDVTFCSLPNRQWKRLTPSMNLWSLYVQNFTATYCNWCDVPSGGITQGFRYSIIVDVHSPPACKNNQIYDKTTRSCVSFRCVPGYEPTATKSCRKVVTAADEEVQVADTFSLRVTDDSQTKLRSSFIDFEESSLDMSRAFFSSNASEAQITLQIMGIHRDRPELVPLTNIGSETVFRMNISRSDAFDIAMKNFASKSSTKLYFTSMRDQFVTHLYGFDVRKTFPGQRICAKHVVLPVDQATFNSDNTIIIKNKTYTQNSYIVWQEIKNSTENRFIAVCTTFHLHKDCPIRIVPPWKYTVESFDKKILLNDDRTILSPTEYVPLADGIGICINENHTPNWLSTIDEVEFYISVSCIPISILCLIFTIIVFTFYKELRSLPSFNLVALCVSICGCDLLFVSTVAARDHTTWCKVVGIALHFFLLLVLSWSVFVCYELFRQLSNPLKAYTVSGNKRFYAYFVIATAIPIIIVAIAVALDETEVFKIGYGASESCWMETLWAKLIWYVTPLCCVFLFNFVSLIYTIRQLRTHQKSAQKGLQKNGGREANMVYVALKLVIILGLIEVLGLIQTEATSTDNHILNATFRLLFTFSRSLRGFMIWILYVPSNGVVKAQMSRSLTSTFTSSTSLHMHSTATKSRAGSESNPNITTC